jgi:hypothetical protein
VIYGLSLAPAGLSGVQVCRYRTPECEAGCVAFSGKGDLPDVIRARQAKTVFLAERPASVLRILVDELDRVSRRFGAQLAVRLNTFSDLPWERIVPWLFERFAGVRFYDYTKWSDRATPENYDLTFSVSDRTPDATAVARCEAGDRGRRGVLDPTDGAAPGELERPARGRRGQVRRPIPRPGRRRGRAAGEGQDAPRRMGHGSGGLTMPMWRVTVSRRQTGTVTVEADDATDAGLFYDPERVEWTTVDVEVTDVAIESDDER